MTSSFTSKCTTGQAANPPHLENLLVYLVMLRFQKKKRSVCSEIKNISQGVNKISSAFACF